MWAAAISLALLLRAGRPCDARWALSRSRTAAAQSLRAAYFCSGSAMRWSAWVTRRWASRPPSARRWSGRRSGWASAWRVGRRAALGVGAGRRRCRASPGRRAWPAGRRVGRQVGRGPYRVDGRGRGGPRGGLVRSTAVCRWPCRSAWVGGWPSPWPRRTARCRSRRRRRRSEAGTAITVLPIPSGSVPNRIRPATASPTTPAAVAEASRARLGIICCVISPRSPDRPKVTDL